ncbi:putative secreted protein (Por secretion system target) [Neolewinella xylanilytica]|uniref:Putative secreted protein (Por secretion system target) n=2 Tax=Neolewinella xylanilytica TaxID=1514080 RepID=A0A2S6I9V5_9BACT|nr:putative secreted protein (Por secretion system target) [Neolewinella xylanilytica]
MSETFLFTLLMLLGSTLRGQQIILNSNYFPEAGDTLKYYVADDGFTVDLLGPGEGVNWNFGELTAASELLFPVTSAVSDSVFTDAQIAMNIESGTVGYFRVTETEINLVGIRGNTPLLEGFPLEVALNPTRPERRAPLSYGDEFEAAASTGLVVAPDDLPQEALDQLNAVVTEAVDSIRLTTSSVRQDEIDATGTLTIDNRTYDVLREKRVEFIQTTVEIKVPILGYVDVTNNLGAAIPDIAEFLGQQPPMTTYLFWSPGVKEAIATVTEAPDGSLTRLTYIQGDATNSTGGPYLRQADINVYPNPTHGLTTFEVNGLDAGNYTIRVLNVLGRKVGEARFAPVSGQAKVPLNLERLPRGTYLYSLTNERGRILTTRRLMVGG